ncbi:hypothetical protein QCA50_018219 [Cerrena zonata]|uniref:tRNA-binding domain-containing protein n=1 Tax=Cerrena zonata TaxID=2478898 RepID=A0AAW0FIJ2_9APHY
MIGQTVLRSFFRLNSTSAGKVGQIIKCIQHPQADKLYVSQVQITPVDPESEGPASTVQICSGLKDYVALQDMQNRKVVVLANLPPSKLRGEKSQAMLLAGEKSDSETPGSSIVKLLNPPVDANLGDKLSFYPFYDESFPAKLKSSKWAPIQSCLKTNEKGQAVYVTETGEQYLLKKSPESEHGAFCDNLPNAIIR